MHGDWKGWKSNSNWGKPSFLEIVFLTYGARKLQEMHAHPIIHPHTPFPHVVESCWDLSFTFSVITSISMVGEK